jgi:hypothetical protein
MVRFVFKTFHLHISYANIFKSLNYYFLLKITSYSQFVFGQIFINFWSKKYDFDLSKGFFMEKMTQIHQILKKKLESPHFHDKF